MPAPCYLGRETRGPDRSAPACRDRDIATRRVHARRSRRAVHPPCCPLAASFLPALWTRRRMGRSGLDVGWRSSFRWAHRTMRKGEGRWAANGASFPRAILLVPAIGAALAAGLTLAARATGRTNRTQSRAKRRRAPKAGVLSIAPCWRDAPMARPPRRPGSCGARSTASSTVCCRRNASAAARCSHARSIPRHRGRSRSRMGRAGPRRAGMAAFARPAGARCDGSSDRSAR